MSLLDEAMESCVILDKTTVTDGYGGVITTYVPGAPIDAAFAYDDTALARIAAVQGATDNVKVITRKNVILRSGDVIQRKSNGKTYQITSNGDDNKTPQSAALDALAVNAKEWSVPVAAAPEESGGDTDGQLASP